MKKIIAISALVLSSIPIAFAADEIPVDRVILSSSGLANFVHKAKVTGDTQVVFPVRFEQVDDIMKSLIVFDKKGRLGGVTLPGRQPLDQVFKDLPFTREQIQSPLLLLNAYQGAVVTIKDTARNITGRLVQVEPFFVQIKDKSETRHRISLMTDTGLKQAVMEEVQTIQFNDDKIRAEIARALEAIREYGTQERRLLNVSLKGDGARDVTISYVVDAPLWKTAYRMVVPETGVTSGLLQGWAIVENMTSNDWNNIDLTLVSGNPVTFRQSLYASYYVPRAEVPVQVFGRVMPRVDEGSVAMNRQRAAEPVDAMKKSFGGGQGEQDANMMALAAAPMAAEMQESVETRSDGISLRQGGYGGMQNVTDPANVAESAEAATQVLFRFPDRLSLKSGQSMMVPFVSRSVPMQRISLYQPETQPRHPLAAVEINNDGDTGLPAGVLTIYEESAVLSGTAFVGDAQLPAIAAGEKRLVSYAVDNKIKITRSDASASSQGKLSMSQGLLRQSYKTVMTTSYTIEAPKKESRTLIIEHSKNGDFKLTKPEAKSTEETSTHYRLRFDLKPGEVKKQDVVMEREDWQSFQVLDMSADQITFLLSSEGRVIDADARAALDKIIKARAEMDAVQNDINSLNAEQQSIFNDQARLRQNLESLSGKSALRDTYLEKLEKQEERLAQIEKSVKEANDRYAAARQVLQKTIDQVNF